MLFRVLGQYVQQHQHYVIYRMNQEPTQLSHFPLVESFRFQILTVRSFIPSVN